VCGLDCQGGWLPGRALAGRIFRRLPSRPDSTSSRLHPPFSSASTRTACLHLHRTSPSPTASYSRRNLRVLPGKCSARALICQRSLGPCRASYAQSWWSMTKGTKLKTTSCPPLCLDQQPPRCGIQLPPFSHSHAHWSWTSSSSSSLNTAVLSEGLSHFPLHITVAAAATFRYTVFSFFDTREHHSQPVEQTAGPSPAYPILVYCQRPPCCCHRTRHWTQLTTLNSAS